MNNTQTWRVDAKYLDQAEEALDRVYTDLEYGILGKLKMLRMKELEQHIIKNCYQNKSYNFFHGQMCD